MKKVLYLAIFCGVFLACSRKVDPADVTYINGYWEIEKVVLPDGQEKTYTINPVYDYFELKNGKGFRKKVMPQFDGKYLTNDLSEQISVVTSDGATFLEYATPYAKWREQLLEITPEKMVVENAEEKTYHYKKATALNLTGHGKETSK